MAKTRLISFNGANAQGMNIIKSSLKSNKFICKIKQFPAVANSDFI